MADSEPPAVDLLDVTVTYGSRVALDAISGQLRAGDSLALIGPNGAGKSTLLRTMLGLTPVVSGTVRVLGSSPNAVRSRIAYVPQADVLDPAFPVTASDVVLMGRYRRIGWLRRPGAADRAVGLAALERVGMADRAKDRFGLLSGGQRQRVLLARAVAQEATLLLLDEPFNGVDTGTVDAVLGILEELRGGGAAVVMSTHDLAVARAASTHAMLLNKSCFAFGRVEDVATEDHLRRAYGDRARIMSEHNHS